MDFKALCVPGPGVQIPPHRPGSALTKTWRVMRLTALFIFIACMQVSAATRAQNVTISGKNVTLEKIFSEIRRQAGYDFIYNEFMLQKASLVTIDVKGVAVEDALQQAFSNQPFTYTILDGKTIVVKEKKVAEASPLGDTARTVTVTGTVYNESRQPLSGANVVIKETQKGTVTNAKGEFDLGTIPVGSTLIISYIGYERQIITIKGAIDARVVLKPTKNELDKVVIQAYGETSQRLTTGSIGVVTSEQIERQPVTNVMEALQGQVPGLLIDETNGNESAPFKVEIRGRNSINANFPSDPLYVIDGVPLILANLSGADNTSSYQTGSMAFDQTGLSNDAGANGQSPFFSLNPADIESVEILKDADATAIYGSRGANGAILITTKKGKAGKTKLDLNVYQGVSAITKTWDMMNTQQYLSMRQEALRNDGIAPTVSNSPDLLVWDTSRNENWQKYLWGNWGKVTDAQAALSGGDAQTTFRLSADYRRKTDITTYSGANQRASVSVNIGHKGLNQRFGIDFTTNYSFAESNIVNTGGQVTSAPDAPPVYDALGYLNFAGWAPAQSYYPFGNLQQPYTGKTYFLTSNLVGSYRIIRSLTAKVNLGFNNMNGNETYFQPIASQNPQYNPTGTAQFGANQLHGWIAEPQLEYNSFLSKGKLSALVGGTYNSAYQEAQTVIGGGYTSDILLHSIQNAVTAFANDNSAQDKYAAIFGRLNYNWQNKYIINLSGRRDGSSRFAPGSQYGNFWSAGGAWIFSEEPWVKKHLGFLSFGKFRGSYGITGADNIGDYAYLASYMAARAAYNGSTSLLPNQLSDSNYRWEVDKKAELSLDLGFLGDRISIEGTVYRNRCNNQLINFPTPEITGFSYVVANSPANVQNMGEEFMLNAIPVQTKNVKWTLNFNISHNDNKLLSYPDLANSPYAANYIIGYTLNFAPVLHYLGVDPQTGQYAYLDRNHDGVISGNPGPTSDLAPLNLNPKYYGGFTNTISYKGFQVSFLFYFKKQLGQNALFVNGAGVFEFNAPADYVGKEWQYPGEKATFARYTTMPTNNDAYFKQSDANYTDASYIRLKNVSVSYSLPDKTLQKSGIRNLSIYVRGENLLLITGYKGLDPETQNFGSLPLSKIITMGVSASF
jgi:TonB-linked SusC/RagA family outer membrane protein